MKMRKRSNLKKLYTDIAVFVLIFALLGAVVLLEKRGYHAVPNTTESGLLEEDEWNEAKNASAGKVASNAPRCLVLRNSRDYSDKNLSDNISFTLSSLNVRVTVKDVVLPGEADDSDKTKNKKKNSDSAKSREKAEFPSELDKNKQITYEKADTPINYGNYDEIAFCFSDFSVFEPEIAKISAWLKNGGHLLFAGGIDEKVNLAKWADILGADTEKKPAPAVAESLKINTELLAGAQGRTFSDDVISGEVLNLAVRDDCTVHLSTADGNAVPLLWEHSVDKGTAVVCNSDLMESKSDRGLISAVYCRFYPVYAYPVINACVYCIDDCPSPIPAGFEKNVVSQYGYTVGDFYSNVWMPAMQRISEDYGIKYSTFAIQSYDDNTDGKFDNTDNRDTASYYAGLILNMGGEVGIHGYNHQPLCPDDFKFDKENAGYKTWPNVMSMLNSVKAAVKYTESLSDELYVNAYVAPSNVISKEALSEMLSQVENIRVYAGVYTGTRDQFIQEYKVLDNGVVFCPRLTADMQMEDSEWWTQINELNYHYVESNFIHPDDILDEQRSDGGDFNQMISGYTKMIEWNRSMGLRNTTISECGGAVQRYCNLNYTQTFDGSELKLNIEGLIDTAYMMIRTNGKNISSVEGGSVKECGGDVYILKAESPAVTIKTVDK